eukprot:719570_1
MTSALTLLVLLLPFIVKATPLCSSGKFQVACEKGFGLKTSQTGCVLGCLDGKAAGKIDVKAKFKATAPTLSKAMVKKDTGTCSPKQGSKRNYVVRLKEESMELLGLGACDGKASKKEYDFASVPILIQTGFQRKSGTVTAHEQYVDEYANDGYQQEQQNSFSYMDYNSSISVMLVALTMVAFCLGCLVFNVCIGG